MKGLTERIVQVYEELVELFPGVGGQEQCELGLEWLKQGRIDGMIFLASCICDLDLETVEWTRKWIQKVGDQELA